MTFQRYICFLSRCNFFLPVGNAIVQSWAAIYVPFNCTFSLSLSSYNLFFFFLILECEFVYRLSLAAVVQIWATPAVGTLAIPVDKYRRALCVVLVGLPHFCGLGAFSRPTFAEHCFNLLRFLFDFVDDIINSHVGGRITPTCL